MTVDCKLCYSGNLLLVGLNVKGRKNNIYFTGIFKDGWQLFVTRLSLIDWQRMKSWVCEDCLLCYITAYRQVLQMSHVSIGPVTWVYTGDWTENCCNCLLISYRDTMLFHLTVTIHTMFPWSNLQTFFNSWCIVCSWNVYDTFSDQVTKKLERLLRLLMTGT